MIHNYLIYRNVQSALNKNERPRFLKTLFLLVCLVFGILQAKDVHPLSKFYSIGYVNDFVVDKNLLYAANDMGTVDIFDIKSAKIVDQILLPPIISSMNKIIPADILSVDRINDKVLMVSIAQNGYRDVWVYENHELKLIIGSDKKLSVKEARFINADQILLATIDSDVVLHDISENYNIYHSHKSHSAMGDISLSKNKKEVVLADESGEVKIIDAKSSKTLQSFSSQNVDNIFRVAYANNVIITAGQDRRVGVYIKDERPYHIKSDFLVFCVGISPSGNIGVYSSGEENFLQVFDTRTKKKKDRLIGHKKVINQIKFTSERELFTSSRDNYIFRWRLEP